MNLSISQKIQRWAFHPTLHALLYPLSFILLGIIYGSRAGQFRPVNTVLILLYAISFHFIDRTNRHQDSLKDYISQPAHIGLLLVFLLLSISIALRSTISMAFLLILNLIFLLGKNSFQNYSETNHLYITLLRALYYGILLNSMAFFLESHVMIFRLAVAGFPLLLLHFFYLKGHVSPTKGSPLLLALRMVPYLIYVLLTFLGKMTWIGLPFFLIFAVLFNFGRQHLLPDNTLIHQRILSTHELLVLSLVVALTLAL